MAVDVPCMQVPSSPPILLTGAGGYLGSLLTGLLLRESRPVRALDSGGVPCALFMAHQNMADLVLPVEGIVNG